MSGFLRRAVHRLHFVVGCLVGLFSFLFLSAVGIVYILVRRSQRREAAVLFARAFSGVMRFVLGWRVACENLSFFAEHRPAVIVANHQSNLDVVTYGAIYPVGCVVIAKKELAWIPIFGWFYRATGNIWVDRENRERALPSIDEAARRIQDERVSVWLFPEGHRNQKPELLPFKKGAFHLAIAAQVPVLVIVCEPIGTLLDAQRGLVRAGTIRMRILPPIPTAAKAREDVDALIEEVRAVMQATREELRATARERIG